ncbi:MAG TPA: serine hydrolase [Roseiflexaceae bacterium]|nr:serine hydrolase [Roseiflexaceae bacterium]
MSAPVEQRIARVVAGLLPETAIKGRFGPARSLEARMAARHTPGVSIAVVNDSAVEWARGFGLADAGSDAPVTPTTLFQAASISKPIAALAVMRLVEQGRLDLDADVNRALRAWQVPAASGWQPAVSLRQLLSHSAGLTVHGFPGYQTDEPLPSTVQILNGEPPTNTARVEVNILPGVQMRYSGGGTTVVQQLLVDTLDTPFPEIMRRLVLDPLGLTNSTYEQPLPAGWAGRAATAHPWKGIPLRGGHQIYPEMAAAGLWTTPSDLAAIGIALLQALDGSGSFLSAATVEQMLQPQLPGQRAGEGEYVGLGFFCAGKGDGFFFGHGGWNEGFLSVMRFYPRIGKGAAVMLNSNEGIPLLEEIMRAIGQEYGWPEVPPAEKTAVELSGADRYTGTYTADSGLTFQLTSDGSGLTLQLDHQPPLPLLPSAEHEFFTRALNTTVSFEQDSAGQITGLTVSQDGQRIAAKRQVP